MSSIENEYRQQQGDDYQEYLEFKEKRDRKKGILPKDILLVTHCTQKPSSRMQNLVWIHLTQFITLVDDQPKEC